MVMIITTIFLALASATASSGDHCPLSSIEPTQDVKKLSGKWLEYKKTTDFLTNNVCTTYDVNCSNDTACNVNLTPNGTNTGLTNTLLAYKASTLWGTEVIYLNVHSEKPFAILWNCSTIDETMKYELVVLVKNISDEETLKDVDELLQDISKKYKFQTEAINNTLCSGVQKSTVNFTALAILLLFTMFTKINN